jgi:hypothetical protein
VAEVIATPPPLADAARWLHQKFTQPPAEFEAGRRELVQALATYASCSIEEADHLLDELERGGFVRYAAEGRSVGGGGGYWMVYSSPRDNPDEGIERSSAT